MRLPTIPAGSRRRKARQRGTEILEFALVALLYIPLLMGTFITGMNVIRSIQANYVTRDMADMYIHGADFSTYSMQTVAQRLASGMGLDIGSSFTGNLADNSANNGTGLVWVSQLMWIGDETDPNCVSVAPDDCTNANSFVFTQRILFGNGTLVSERPSTLGDPTISTASNGTIALTDAITDAGAAVPGQYQTDLQSLWQTTNNGQSPLVDGQIVYVVEAYFHSPDLNLGSYPGRGVYARWFF